VCFELAEGFHGSDYILTLSDIMMLLLLEPSPGWVISTIHDEARSVEEIFFLVIVQLQKNKK
jgi:hypothetical protein